MPIQESSATALVRLTGLAMILFNEQRGRGEAGIIRDGKHKLTVKIQQPIFQEGTDSDRIVYQDLAVYENLPNDDVEIEIKAETPAINGYEIYQPGTFDRLESTDFNDFRWIVNMSSDLHGNQPLVKPDAADRYPLTKLYIENGLFYTCRLDRNLFFEKVEKDSSGAAQTRQEFGYIAETIGVKIDGAAVVVTVRIGGKDETHVLNRVEGFPFRIEITNMDYSADAVYSDMPDYYRYQASPTGGQFDLKPVTEDGSDKRTKGGAVNQDDFCHPILMSVPSLDEL